MTGWTNVDAVAGPGVDVVCRVPPLPFDDETATEIFACHFLEHLTFDDAQAFLGECRRVLRPGGRLGLVVPDGREVLGRWLHETHDEVYITDRWWSLQDLDQVCTVFLYGGRLGINEASRHQWLWDQTTLARAMQQHGFGELRRIDRYRDGRLAAPAWFQCGVDGVKP